jgi:ABC-type glycerol-3-phosphate transport system permease component
MRVHLRPRGAGLLVAALLVLLYLATHALSIISVCEIQTTLGPINSTTGLLLRYITVNLAISILIMRSVFLLVLHEVIEAAKVGGAGPSWRTLLASALPMARNRLVDVSIVNFVTAWGEFLLCTTLTNDQAARTMPVVLAGSQAGLASGHGQISLRCMSSSS